MYTYKLKIKKVSGRLNESILPSKNLVIKSKKSLSKNAILKEANAYFKKHYGLTVESLEIWDEDDLEEVNKALRFWYNKWAGSSERGKQNKKSLYFVIELLKNSYEIFKNSKYSNRMHRHEDDIDYENQYEIKSYHDAELSKLLGDEIKYYIMDKVKNFCERTFKGKHYTFAWLSFLDLYDENINPVIKYLMNYIKGCCERFMRYENDNVDMFTPSQIDDIRGINDMY